MLPVLCRALPQGGNDVTRVRSWSVAYILRIHLSVRAVLWRNMEWANEWSY